MAEALYAAKTNGYAVTRDDEGEPVSDASKQK